MSYHKMMKWTARHPKGIRYNRGGNMGFNPSGVTAQELDHRELLLREKWKTLSDPQLQQYYDENLREFHQFCDEKTISYSFEQCAFERYIRYNPNVHLYNHQPQS